MRQLNRGAQPERCANNGCRNPSCISARIADSERIRAEIEEESSAEENAAENHRVKLLGAFPQALRLLLRFQSILPFLKKLPPVQLVQKLLQLNRRL